MSAADRTTRAIPPCSAGWPRWSAHEPVSGSARRPSRSPAAPRGHRGSGRTLLFHAGVPAPRGDAPCGAGWRTPPRDEPWNTFRGPRAPELNRAEMPRHVPRAGDPADGPVPLCWIILLVSRPSTIAVQASRRLGPLRLELQPAHAPARVVLTGGRTRRTTGPQVVSGIELAPRLRRLGARPSIGGRRSSESPDRPVAGRDRIESGQRFLFLGLRVPRRSRRSHRRPGDSRTLGQRPAGIVSTEMRPRRFHPIRRSHERGGAVEQGPRA